MPDPSRPGISRRQFVRRAVASATVGAAAAAGYFSWRDSAEGSGSAYLGMKVVFGPAGRGVPLLPVRVDPDGFLVGVADQMRAMQSCHRGAAPGLEPGYEGDDRLFYHENPERLQVYRSQGTIPWWEPFLGAPARAQDFPAVGSGAPVRWRSQGQTETNAINVIVIRAAADWYPEEVRKRFAPDGFVAASAQCTHFCCTLGYQVSRTARQLGYEDHLFCDCHAATFDPRQVVTYRGRPDG